ncbi:MAG TPA: protein kinase [Isosphaeraceae bacterium]|jgi:serine/threonine-protein kinase|nr:protein kinase [Isosphaeraceae bacterium]
MIGQKLGSFRIEVKIGSGAMGVVYRGVNEATGRLAAIKVVTAELAQKGTAFERFKREAEILQQFRHPNIVRFLAFGRSQGTSYFAMEYVQGITLDVLITQRGFLPWQEVLQLAIQTCDALHYAHQHGVVHRDLKPSNLMISEKGEIKLTDFGIAKDLDATALTATGRTLGTAAYMAPEQIRGTPEVSHKTDLYALGVVIYELLTGEVPFQGPTAVVLMHRHLTDEPPRPSSKLSEIPRDLDDLVLRLMAKEPSDRPWDAAAVGMVLTELRDKINCGEPIDMVWPTMGADGRTLITGTKRQRKPGKSKRKSRFAGLEVPWLQTGLLALALVALLGVAAYLLWPPSDRYLFHKAEALMASADPLEWNQAQKDYLDELDLRYQDHPEKQPFRRQTDEWRDRILLRRAERRSAVLQKSGLGGISRPDGEGETLFKSVNEAVEQDINDHRELSAIKRWQEMAATVESQFPKERGWLLLARERARTLDKKIRDRRELVNEDLKRAEALAASGKVEEAMQKWSDIADRYAPYPDLSDLIEPVRTGVNEYKKAQPSGGSTHAPTPGSDQAAPPPAVD